MRKFKLKKFFAGVTAASLLAVTLLPVTAISGDSLDVTGERNYEIDSPYESVDWDTWGSYKAGLHLHTVASDGASQIDETVEKHYEQGFDILSISDHAVLGTEWNKVPKMVFLFRLVKYDRTKLCTPNVLTDERREEILAGVGRDGRGMLEVTSGIELNGGVPSNSHVNALFADYGQGLLGADGDYETPVREVEKRGGITFLDHLGFFTKAGDENNPDNSRDPKYVNKFANIFLKYPSCVAMDVNSGANTDTKYDDILWDEVLKKTIPNGRNVFGISFSDGHGLDQFDRAFSVMVMPENTVANLRTSMETGTFFAVGRYARVELGDDFVGSGAVPAVTRIEVDDSADSITLTAENTDKITWISNGEKIAYGASIDLNAHEDAVGCYVRAILTGPGGICYTQPFVVTDTENPTEPQDVPFTVDYSLFSRIFINAMLFIFTAVPELRLLRRLLVGV